MLKPSEELFKFPVRIFDPVELEEEDHLVELTSKLPERDVRDYAVGWKRVQIETITDWGESFSKGRTIEDVKNNGFDSTLVYIGTDSYQCNWDMKRFEREYDKHFRKLLKQSREIAELDFLEEINEEAIIKQFENLPTNAKQKPTSTTQG